jgi:hypothetical protein
MKTLNEKHPIAFVYVYQILTESGYKYYIGSTILTIAKRAGSSYSSYKPKGKKQSPFYNCLKKYPKNIEVFYLEFNNITSEQLQNIEQEYLDLTKNEKGKYPKYILNSASKTGGGILFSTREEHAKACLAGGGDVPKPITVWCSETGEIIFQASSTCCKNLQEFMGIDSSHIYNLLDDNRRRPLVQKSISGRLVTLTYQTETLEQRIKSSTRIFSEDLETAQRLNIINKVFTFYNNRTNETKTIKGCKTHMAIGRELNLKHPNTVSYLISGKRKTSEGWSLVSVEEVGVSFIKSF